MGDVKEEPQRSCYALKKSIDAILALHSCNSLNMSYGFMSKSTAIVVAQTLKTTFQVFRDYLMYIEYAHLCDVIVAYCLRDKLD